MASNHDRWSIVCLIALFLSMILVGGRAEANQCDCQEKIARCQGAVELTKAFGSAPSYGAEIAIYSSEKVCSKVEFYIDSTPYQTILVNKNKDSESIFGTSPIKASAVKYSACWVCKKTTSQASLSDYPSNNSQPVNSPFAGKWILTDRNIFGFTNTSTYTVTVNNNVISGTFQDPEGNIRALTGVVNGNQAAVSCDNCFDITWTLTSPDAITYSYPFGSGAMRKQP